MKSPRSASTRLAKAIPMRHEDVSRQSPETQMRNMRTHLARLNDDLRYHVIRRNTRKVETLCGIIADLHYRIQMLADQLGQASQQEARPKARVLPDLTVDLRRYAPIRKSFDRPYVNKGKLIRFTEDDEC